MRKLFVGVLAILLFAPITVAQQSLSEGIVSKIRDEAFQRSQIEALTFYLTDYAGPRLVGSKLGERAEILAKEKLIQLGFPNVRIEYAADFPVGGWDNLKTYAAMTEPYYSNLVAVPKGWSGSTNGLVRGEVVLLDVKTPEDVEKYRGKLTDKIVLMPERYKYALNYNQISLARRYTDEQLDEFAGTQPLTPLPSSSTTVSMLDRSFWEVLGQLNSLLREEKPSVIIHGLGSFNVTSSGMVDLETAVDKNVLGIYRYNWSRPPESIAELNLPIEAHGRMARLIANNIPVSMEVEIKNEFYDNQVVNNVIAEIPGTDPNLKDEVVLIGAHLDSWFGGTGASDNAASCAVMIEAMRIIKETGIQPRRTIRLALWGGEELGMLGSQGYRQNFLYDYDENRLKEGYDKFALYLNQDNGSGKIRGIHLEENDMAFSFFKEWNSALDTLGLAVLSPQRNGGQDHLSFDHIGLPSYTFIQDLLEYGRSIHNIMDVYERLNLDDMKYNAAVIASLALSAAMDNDKIPSRSVPGLP